MSIGIINIDNIRMEFPLLMSEKWVNLPFSFMNFQLNSTRDTFSAQFSPIIISIIRSLQLFHGENENLLKIVWMLSVVDDDDDDDCLLYGPDTK